MMDLYPIFLFTIILAASIVFVCVALMTRGITFYSTETDNWKMVRAAAQFRLLSWPSRMHLHPFGRAQGREYWVVFLSLVQRLLSDRKTDYPSVVLSLMSHSLSAVLLFQVASGYWSPVVGFIIALIYLSSFWPLQLAILIGHIHLSHAFFLLAVVMTQWAMQATAPIWMVYDVLSGIFFAVSFFSSPSSRKFVPLFLGAFLYRLSGSFTWPPHLSENPFDSWLAASFVPLACVIVPWMGVGLMRLFPKAFARFLHRHRDHPWGVLWFGQMARPDAFQYYETLVSKILRLLKIGSLVSTLYIFAVSPFVSSMNFYLSHICLLIGVSLVFFHVMMPHFRENLGRFWVWFNICQWGRHFFLYREFFSKIGRPMPKDMRGAGFQWVHRFFMHVVPLITVLWIGLFIFIISSLIGKGWEWAAVLKTCGLILLSLSPLLVGELTGGSQSSRTYFPSFTGFLIFIAYATHRIDLSLVGHNARFWYWFTLGIVLVANAMWNIWIFLDDVWPARMGPSWMAQTLQRLGIKRFYTYDTPYNDAFVNVLPQEERDRYEICYIKTLAGVEGNVIVVPGTSSKAINMESQKYAIEHGDFNEDPLLSKLIESKAIEDYALASFKTLGTSSMFVHEADMTTYRSLILKDITEEDRWRGRGWILDGKKLYEYFHESKSSAQPIGAYE